MDVRVVPCGSSARPVAGIAKDGHSQLIRISGLDRDSAFRRGA